MATEEPVVAAEPKTKKASKPRNPPLHPPYVEMVTDAIATLKDKSGSSQYAITKFIEEKQKQLPPNFKKLLLFHLKKLVASGKIVKVKASFKLPLVEKPKTATEGKKVPAKVKAVAAAKPKSVTKAKPAAKAKVAAKPKAVTSHARTSRTPACILLPLCPQACRGPGATQPFHSPDAALSAKVCLVASLLGASLPVVESRLHLE